MKNKKIIKSVVVYVIGIGTAAAAIHYINYIVDKIMKKKLKNYQILKKLRQQEW